MQKYKIALEILTNYFPKKCASQPMSDWQGPLMLPQDLIEYYTLLGPLNVSLPGYGDDFYLPQLADLWNYQEGYRWDALTKEKLIDWNPEWLVIADQGADPIIFSLSNGIILFDYHGQGFWQPQKLFDDIENMATCLLILSSIVMNADGQLTDNEGRIVESFRQDAQKQLSAILRSSLEIQNVLSAFGWV